MADYLASVDAGNGATNTYLMDMQSGKIKSGFVPSVRSSGTKDTLGLANELDRQYVDWYGQTYFVGDEASHKAQERHMGRGRYGEEFYRFMTAVSLAKLGVKSGSVDLTVFAPPGVFMDVKDTIVENFQAAPVRIALKGDKKPREWEYSSVTVLPEGIGAAAAFALNDAGDVADTGIFSGDVVVLDIGAFTLDALRFQNGNFDPESLEQATWENAGVNTHVWQRLRKKLSKMDGDFEVVTVDDLDKVIRRGFAQSDWQLTVAGKMVNLESTCKTYFEQYADWIANNICDGVFNGFRGIKSVILVGGGAVMTGNKLRGLYAEKILDQRAYAHVKKVHPADLNAVGGLRYAVQAAKSK
jgi:hypothetical protein